MMVTLVPLKYESQTKRAPLSGLSVLLPGFIINIFAVLCRLKQKTSKLVFFLNRLTRHLLTVVGGKLKREDVSRGPCCRFYWYIVGRMAGVQTVFIFFFY